jgi:hypothetical protein
VLDILMRAGQIAPMPPEMVEAGARPLVYMKNPLARMARAGEAAAFTRWVEIGVQAAGAGAPEALDRINFDKGMVGVGEVLGVRPSWMLSDDELARCASSASGEGRRRRPAAGRAGGGRRRARPRQGQPAGRASSPPAEASADGRPIPSSSGCAGGAVNQLRRWRSCGRDPTSACFAAERQVRRLATRDRPRRPARFASPIDDISRRPLRAAGVQGRREAWLRISQHLNLDEERVQKLVELDDGLDD